MQHDDHSPPASVQIEGREQLVSTAVWEDDRLDREIISAGAVAQQELPTVVTILGGWAGLLRSAWLLSQVQQKWGVSKADFQQGFWRTFP